MKHKKSLGFASVFCAGMLSLTACSEPQDVYGPPQNVIESPSDVTSENPQTVYGPPAVTDSTEESAFSSAEN